MKGEGSGITGEERQEVYRSDLLEEIGVDEREIEWRKDFTGLEEEDERRLAEMSEIAEPVIDDAVAAFYDNLQSYEETRKIFDRSPKSVPQLKQAQQQYLTELFGGQYERSYFESRARIGKIHDMLNLGPKIYFGAYTQFYEHLIDALVLDLQSRLARTDGGTAARSETGETIPPAAALEELAVYTQSILKAINLDQQIVMDTYIHSYNRRLESELERQEAVADEVARHVTDTQAETDDIANRSNRVSQVAHEQADSVERINGKVADMTAAFEEINASAEEVAATSERAEERAQEGRKAADEAISLMEEIDTSTTDVAQDVAQLEERIDEVDEVVELINEIADQTNLLALNANIEAARAGEAGDGFRVVANEVKSLAEESQEHASEVETLVAGIKTDANDAVASLEATRRQIDRGIEQVNGAMETLQDIAQAVQETSEGIQEVSEATDDQAASTEEIGSMVDELLEQANRVADEVDRVAAANDEQAENIEEISTEIQRLRTE